ncbi:HNH endonuclease [Streptomyces sp. NPDC004838]
MSGGWAGSNRRAELPPNWAREIRPAILQRDQYRCRWDEAGRPCGHAANQVDHIGDKHDHRPENLQALCEHHHAIKTSRQGNAARWAETARRPPEKHPGLI